MLTMRSFSIYSLIFAVITILLLAFFHLRGFIPYDEGWFLQAGLRILDGERIYKDFEFLYNPGGAIINAIGFILFGESLLSSRIIAFLNSALSVLLLASIFNTLKLNKFYNYILLLVFIFWGPAHINFVWPVMLSITCALATIYLLLKINNNDPKHIFMLIGIVSAIAFLFKQNFGIAMLAFNTMIFIAFKKYRNLKLIRAYLFGYLIIAGITILYFLQQQTLQNYIYEIYNFTVVKIFHEGILNSTLPWNYPAPIASKVFKFALYTSPLTLGTISLIFSLRQKNIMLITLPVLSIVFYVFSIRPTTDFPHLTPLISLSILPIAVIYIVSSNKMKKIIFICSLILLTCGIYSSTFRNYYKWNSTVKNQNIFSMNPRTLVFMDKKESNNVKELSEHFSSNYQTENYIFIYDFAPGYYLILNKKNPTRYDYLHQGVMDDNKRKDIIEILERKNIKVILTNRDISKNNDLLARYILDRYSSVASINEYSVWERLKQTALSK